MLHDGRIEGKWSHNALPIVTPDTPTIDKGGLNLDKGNDTSTAVAMILWFAIPLALLTIADRFWAWTKWVRRRREG